jgi:hypothetical protein
MTFANEGGVDRAVRMLGGIPLMFAGASAVSTGALGIALTVVGGIAFLTGLAGWCPAYSVFHLSTNRSAAQRCASCDTAQRL